MGTSPYYYFVEYEEDLQKALDRLRRREFDVGRYYPAVSSLDFPVTDNSPSPGPKHHSIAEALNKSGADGTRSVLDLEQVVHAPYTNDRDTFGVVFPLSNERLVAIFGSIHPSEVDLRELLFDVIDAVERGMGVYVVGYREGRPKTRLFTGYTND